MDVLAYVPAIDAWGVSFENAAPEVWAVYVWWLHGAVSGHDVLFCMYYAWPTFVTEGAMGSSSGDFVMFFIHVFKYLIFVCVVLIATCAVPVCFVVLGVWFYAVIEYFHHHLRWSPSLPVSHNFMFIRCFFGVLLHISAQCCCSVVFCGIRGHVLVRICVLRLFMFARGMGEYGHWAFPMVVLRCMRAVCE